MDDFVFSQDTYVQKEFAVLAGAKNKHPNCTDNVMKFLK